MKMLQGRLRGPPLWETGRESEEAAKKIAPEPRYVFLVKTIRWEKKSDFAEPREMTQGGGSMKLRSFKLNRS
jgi:hypothetical protein